MRARDPRKGLWNVYRVIYPTKSCVLLLVGSDRVIDWLMPLLLELLLLLSVMLLLLL